MVPAALPARSAPTGVNSLLRRAASACVTFASSGLDAPITATAMAAINRFRILNLQRGSLERLILTQFGALFASFKRPFQVVVCSFL
jgi:hypothetical protein